MGNEEARDYWSDCVHIYFHYGRGYGVTEELQNICLGKEEDIKKFFETGELNTGLSPTQIQVLIGILEYRQEEGIGTTTTRTAGMERTGNNGASRRKPKATRLPTFRKRIPLRPPRTKNESISRR